jgi:hypothetical protein
VSTRKQQTAISKQQTAISNQQLSKQQLANSGNLGRHMRYCLAEFPASSSVNFLTISFAPAALPNVGFVSNAFLYDSRALAFSPF